MGWAAGIGVGGVVQEDRTETDWTDTTHRWLGGGGGKQCEVFIQLATDEQQTD